MLSEFSMRFPKPWYTELLVILSLPIISNHILDLAGGGKDIANPRHSMNDFSDPPKS